MRTRVFGKTLVAVSLAVIFLLLSPYLVRMGGLSSTHENWGVPVMVGPANGFGTPTGVSAPSNLMITASVGLFDKTQSDSLQALLSGLYDPGSSLYHQFLTSSQYSDIFAPSTADYASAVGYFQGYGLTTYTSQSRLFINLEGTAAQFSAALNTQLMLYSYNRLTFYENSVPLYLPQSIAQYATSVIGMENYTFYVPYHIIQQVNPSSPIPPFAPPYQPSALEGAYNETGLLNSGYNGTGRTIVLVDAGYGDKSIQVDASEFSLTYSLPNPIVSIQTVNSSDTIQDVQLDTENGVLSQVPGLGVLSGWDVETALDVEWSHAMAPGANLINMISFDPGVGLDQAVATAITTAQPGYIISQSFGQWEGFSNVTYTGGPPGQTDAGYVDPFYQMAAATGVTVLASSGDSGSTSQSGAPPATVNWPASDPWVTAVGGTAIQISSGGQWQSEAAWSCDPGCTGGGYSTSYPRPSYQSGPGLPVTGQYANSRGVPDIAADADPNTGVVYVVNGVNYGVAFSLGGTSLASPLWAGVIATLESFKSSIFGFYSPTAYSILNSPGYKSQFHDITSGSNGVYSAGPGWDPTTGIGSPNVGCLAYVCNQNAQSGFTIRSPTSGTLVNSTSLTVNGVDNLQPGNWLTGPPNNAPGYLTGTQQNQLNILAGWISNYHVVGGQGYFSANLNLTDLTNLLTAPAPSEGEAWYLQWGYGGTTYFATMSMNLEGAISATGGPAQVGINYGAGYVGTLPSGGNFYNTTYTAVGTYTATAPGTITITVPTSEVGGPVAGSALNALKGSTYELVDVAGTGLLEPVDSASATIPYMLGSSLLPAGYIQVATNPGQTGAVNATFINYPSTNQWTANLNLSGLSPGPQTIYAREVGPNGVVIQTTSTPIVYTVGMSKTAAITSIYMVNGNGANQTIFANGTTGIALITVKNTGLLPISGGYVMVQFTSTKGKTIFTGYASLPSLSSGQSAAVGIGTTFTQQICKSGVYTAQGTVWNGFPTTTGSTQIATPKSTSFVLSCH
jgi:hypothetical protein